MPINIYKDPLQKAYLFGAPVLYSTEPIPREDVPSGWYCYDLRGTETNPEQPYSLVDQAEKNHAGSVLSYLPLKNGRSQSRLVKGMFQLTGEQIYLADFCADEKIRCPKTPLRHLLRPASPQEAGLFYALPPEKDKELVGRISFADGTRMDFTNPEGYIQAIREELPCMATTGFRCETLTDDPEVRHTVEDIVCNFYGEESPRQLEEQKEEQGMTFGGM